MRANFISYSGWPDSDEMFTKRFKRKMKVWTIESIHELWERACVRAGKRQSESSDYLQEIVKEVPKNDRGEHVVYFKQKGDENGRIFQYKISYHKDWKGYGVSTDLLEFSKDKVQGRDEKITFLLTNQEAFEMGQKYHELNLMKTNLQHRVKHILWEMVEDKLRDHYKKIDQNPPDISIIEIGGSKYYVKVDEQHRYGWLKFHWAGCVTDDTIKL